MDGILNSELWPFIQIMLALAGMAFALAVLLLGYIIWRVKHIHLPPGADTMTALRHTPLSVVLLLDLLDMSLDIFSAPFAWVILGYLGLQPLRGVTVVEGFIPGTQLIPTMTAAWIFARVTDPERKRIRN